MIYEGQICRGPMERSSFMLPVAVGCSYNRCRFCNLFKHLKYRQLPMEQVEEEILRVQALGGDPETVFLGDGNAFGLETCHLLEIAGKIRRSFPSCRSINMDATVTNIRLKSDEELRALAAAGVGHLYLGIESGLDDVLGIMEKDHTLEQAYEQIQRANTIADLVPNEVEALYTNGPAGGCGAVKRTRDIVSVASILVDRNDVKPEVEIFEV